MLHYDTGGIGKYEETSEGFLRIFGTIAKVGWLDYINKDGSVRKEYVSEETLFDPDHLDSIGGAVVTLGHPPEMVTPDNYNKYTVGATGTKIFADTVKKAIDVVFIVNKEEAINAIKKDGIKELSMGYLCTTKPNENGTFTQIKRVCNHNAIVEKARCNGASLHTDGWYQVNKKDDLIYPSQKELVTIPTYKTTYYSQITL
jgi:hypothetical protein